MGAEVIILFNPYTYSFLKGLTHSALQCKLQLFCFEIGDRRQKWSRLHSHGIASCFKLPCSHGNQPIPLFSNISSFLFCGLCDQCILQLTSLGIDSEMHSHGNVKDGVKCRSEHQNFEMVSSMADPLRVRCKPKHSSCNSL